MDVLSGIVRIRSNKDIGTGFVVSDDGLIVTCAHVLGSSMPEKTLVMFQATGEEQEATVLPDDWRNVGAEDVAFLRIPGPLPDGVQPLPLGSSKGIEGHLMMSFGYPKTGEVERGRATGKILGWGAMTETGQPLLQVHSSEIKEGFSGAPIWDEVRQRVVGMVAIAARQGDTAYATPTETLRAVSSALQLNDLCPYRSLEAFTEKDAAFFFGRQRVIEQLINNLQHEPCFLAVFGASGSGKSSVVQAGLIPRLRNGALPGSDRWEIIVTRPAATDPPFRQLLASLDRPSTRVAFVIDQFEELFASDEDTSSKIITQMAQLLENAPRVTLLIVMRSDFYSLLMRRKTLEKWVPRCVVNVWSPLDREEVEAIIRQPAECLGWRFDEGLVETIVKDVLETPTKARKKVGSETMLPLLESALTQLWERRQDGMLTHDAYRRIGGITGGLSTWADDAYRSFEEKLRPLVRRIFTSLVHLGDNEQNIVDTRRRRPLSELIYCDAEKADVSQIVERLVAKRLLVKDQKDTQEVVEIIHDALLWEWGRLKEWLEDEEDRKFLLWHQELERRMQAWVETNMADPTLRDPYKLYGGADLTQAIEWLDTRASDVREDERAFIQASRERQVQAERQKRRTTRRTFLVGVVGLGLAVGAASSRWWLFQGGTPLAPSLPLPYTFRGHTNKVSSVAWSPDGRRLASASWDSTVQLWDASSGQTLLTYTGHTNAVNSVAWSPDGRRLASASFDRTVRVWDASSGQTQLTYTGHADAVYSVAWSPDGKRLASASGDGTVRVWDANNGQTLLTYTGHTGGVWSVAWSPDSKRLASASISFQDRTVQLWDASSGQTQLTYKGHTDVVSSVVWSPDGRRLASASDDGTVQLWDASSGQTQLTYTGHTNAVNSVAWSPDGKRLASASFDTTVRVWDADNGQTLLTYTGHTNAVNSVAWSPDGKRLASASDDKTVQMWETSISRGSTAFTYRGHTDAVYSVAWSPDGRRLASAGGDKTVQLWDANSGHTQLTYTGHTNAVNSVAWSPDGKRLASASFDTTVRVWDADNGQTLLTYRGHTDVVSSVAWSPDGRRLASAGGDKIVRVWDASSGHTQLTYTAHDSIVNSVVWSPDGRRLASASDDGTVQLWDASSGQTQLTYKGHTNAVNSVAWSPDGKRLASASLDTTVRVWDANNGQTQLTYRGHTDVVSSVAWSPDGKRLASASLDMTVRVWLWL